MSTVDKSRDHIIYSLETILMRAHGRTTDAAGRQIDLVCLCAKIRAAADAMQHEIVGLRGERDAFILESARLRRETDKMRAELDDSRAQQGQIHER